MALDVGAAGAAGAVGAPGAGAAGAGAAGGAAGVRACWACAAGTICQAAANMPAATAREPDDNLFFIVLASSTVSGASFGAVRVSPQVARSKAYCTASA